MKAEYGDIVDLHKVKFENDVFLHGMELHLEFVFQMLIGLIKTEKD